MLEYFALGSLRVLRLVDIDSLALRQDTPFCLFLLVFFFWVTGELTTIMGVTGQSMQAVQQCAGARW